MNTSASSLDAQERTRLERAERAAKLGASGVKTLSSMLSDTSWVLRRQVVTLLADAGQPAVEELCRVLREDRSDEAKNAAAIDALASTDAVVVDAMVELCSDPNHAVVADAVQVLGRRCERRALPLLCRLATATDDNVALVAIEALGRIGGRAAVETLITLVRSGSFFRTFPAIDVLGRSGDPRAVAPLTDLLQDSRYALEAARALGRTVDRGAARPLARMLGSRSSSVVRVAALALAELALAYQQRYGIEFVVEAAVAQTAPTTALRSLLQASSGARVPEQAAIATVLGMLNDRAVVGELASMVDGPPEVSLAAAHALERLGPEVEDQLVMLLQGDSSRRAIVLPLVTRRMDAGDRIVACLDDPDGNVRALAAEALGRTGHVAALKRLFELLGDPNARVVQAAAAAIQALGSDDTERLTLEAARSPDPRVKREALRLIRNFGFNAALPIVLECAADADPRLREAAIMALPLLDHPRALAELEQQSQNPDPKTRATVMRALGQTSGGDAVEKIVLEAVNDTDPWVRYYATQAVGRLNLSAAGALLEQLFADPAGQVRVAAVEALAQLDTEQAFAVLERAASSSESDVRRAAVLGLGIRGRPEALPVLMQALDSDDAATRLVAASALGRLAIADAIAALGRAAHDPDPNVRATAVGILSETPSKEATLALIQLLPRFPELERLRFALSAASPGRIAGISSALDAADDESASILTSALVRMHTHEAQSALLRALESENVPARKAAATALGALGNAEALNALERSASNDPDTEVRTISALNTLRAHEQ
ncbi:MAG TPA: HEAT repeat domain-containing protein [Polyangiaceae bacterium]|nr:HEAT repeat domain-containing protein [Polyangiaceae bacterium]